MSSITVEFEFEIGDVVFFKGSEHSSVKHPKQFVVFERIAHECHGGIQRLYKLETDRSPVPAPLLTKEEPPYRQLGEAAFKERAEMVKCDTRASNEAYDERSARRAARNIREEADSNPADANDG